MRKRWLTLLSVAIAATLVLAACGSGDDDDDDNAAALSGTPVSMKDAMRFDPDTLTVKAGSEVEIFYFGLFPEATGRGLGGVLLSEALRQAWALGSRWTQLPAVSRVWLHTCSLDGPAALPNYQARGLKIYRTEVEQTEVKDASTGLWPATAI